MSHYPHVPNPVIEDAPTGDGQHTVTVWADDGDAPPAEVYEVMVSIAEGELVKQPMARSLSMTFDVSGRLLDGSVHGVERYRVKISRV